MKDYQKEVILNLKTKTDSTWDVIGIAVGEKPETVRKFYQRYKGIEGLPPKW